MRRRRILSESGRVFLSSAERNKRGCFVFRADKKDILPFERKRKRKRQRGHFPSCPLCKPQNSSYPHKRKAGKRGMFAPLSKGGKREPSASGYMRWEQVHTKRRGGDCELSGAVLQLRRGAGNRSARVFIILFFVVVKGAKILAGFAREIFRRCSLTKRVHGEETEQ